MQFDYERDTDIVSPQLQYHTSWEWLMDVVDKILSEKTRAFTMTIKIGREDNNCSLRVANDSLGRYDVLFSEGYNGIKTVYDLVVEFVKWYNTI